MIPQYKKQDGKAAVLLFFSLFLTFGAALPHARLLTAAALFGTLGVFLWERGRVFEEKIPTNAKLYLLFWCFSLSGAVHSLAREATLLAALLRLSYFLPLLLGERRRWLCTCLSLLGGGLGVLAVLLLVTGRGASGTVDESRFGTLLRADAVFGNPNVLAAFLLFGTVLSLVLCLFGDGRRWAYFLSFLSGSLGVLATFCRGAMLALLLAVLLLLLWKFGVRRVLSLLLAAIPALLLFLPTDVLTRLLSVMHPDSSVSYRFSLWRSLFRLPPRALLLGVGEGKDAMHALLFPVLAAGLSHVEHMHSLFLGLLVSTGVFGLALFLLTVLHALFRGGTFAAPLLALLLFGLFDTPLYNPQTEVIFWLSLGLCAENRASLPSLR